MEEDVVECGLKKRATLINKTFSEPHDDDDFGRHELETWRRFVYAASGWLQVSYLCVVAIVTMIDAIGTVTFRWKEYGEMTHSQSDATSVIFFLCKSR